MLTRIASLMLVAATLASGANVFEGCTISAREINGDSITKQYVCGEALVNLSGKAGRHGDGYGEFSQFWSGETSDIGKINPRPTAKFSDCTNGVKNPDGSISIGGDGNLRGYMTTTVKFTCAQGIVELRGQWGEEYQGHWSYWLELGEVQMAPQWVDDVEEHIHFSRSWQKWCKTAYGYKLCGSVETPKINHGAPPAYKR